MQRRNWKEYNDKLVRRGEVYISLDFLDSWDDELAKMNKG
ncbi:MAG: IS5/IS1182 family transposase, partial [Thermoplasmata archaeon]|nr:IS5/IS1182 family transposase [Thermoplasmata archaeon]